MSRPTVTVYSGKNAKAMGTVKLAGVFDAPIRLDVVHHVHRDIAKNNRQPYAVSRFAGHQTSAESWGTGRAVARIPRVPGGGTHRAGQGAFGNMCRGGRMFAPTKTYRRWHRKVNKNQRRFAIVSALAASGSTALVLARGHKVERIPEIPLVISNETIVNLEKTKAAVQMLRVIRAFADVDKAKNSKKIRAGKGKLRNRRYTMRRGPLIVYDQKSSLCHAFRNLPGVDLCSVNALNILYLAPGGHLGRFIIWTRAAYERLDTLYGTYRKPSAEKFGYALPRPVITNSDLGRLINSQEIQAHLRSKRKAKKYAVHKKNPLKNLGFRIKLNPYAKTVVRQEAVAARNRAYTKKVRASQKKILAKGGEQATKLKTKLAERLKRYRVKHPAPKKAPTKKKMNPHRRKFIKKLHK